MPDIFIDINDGQLSIRIKTNSDQNVGYDFQAIDSNQNSIADVNGFLGLNAEQAINALQATPDNYINGYVSGVVEIEGNGNPYDVIVSVIQNSVELSPSINISGSGSNDTVTKFPTFHINKKL